MKKQTNKISIYSIAIICTLLVIQGTCSAKSFTTGNEFQVDNFGVSYKNPTMPDIAMYNSGGFISIFQASTSDRIYAQRVGNDGTLDGYSFPITDMNDSGAQAIAIDAAENLYVAWMQTLAFSTANWKIYVQKHLPDGTDDGSKILVYDPPMQPNIYNIDVIVNRTTQNFAVIWTEEFGIINNIFMQRYKSDKTPFGTKIQVNSCADKETYPSAAFSDDGTIIVTWFRENNLSTSPPLCDNVYGVFARRYDFSNKLAPLLETISVATRPASNLGYIPFPRSDIYSHPNVKAAEDGRFVISWHQKDHTDTNCCINVYESIYIQRFNADGSLINGPEVVSNKIRMTKMIGFLYTDKMMSMNKNGDFVITWNDNTNNNYIYAQLYDANFNKVGATSIQINTSPSNATPRSNPAVAINDDGDFAVVWHSSSKIMGRLFSDVVFLDIF